MPKGYWIAHVKAENADAFSSDAYQAYVAGAGPAFERHGGKFLARGGAFEQVEGKDLGSRHVVIEFPSLAEAQACYDSDEYSKAKENRIAVSTASIILLEGFDG